MHRYSVLIICAFLFFCFGANSQSPNLRHYTVNNGLPSNTIYFCMQDSKGYMWFCTESGMSRFDGKTFETFTIKNGLADNDNFRCIEDSKGRLWFSSFNGKLSYFKNERFINETIDPSLKSDDSSHKFISGMIEDKQGRIWFSKYCKESIYQYDGKRVRKKK